MTEATVRGLSTAQVATILDQNTCDPTGKHGLRPIEMRFRTFNETGEAGNYNNLNAAKIKEALEQWCRDAFVFLDPKNEKDLRGHVDKLDDLLSPLMICNFEVHKQEMTRDEIVQRACTLLTRLPEYPPELPFEYTGSSSKAGQSKADGPWPDEYFVNSTSHSSTAPATTQTSSIRDGYGYEWSRLRVLSRPSTNVVRIALFLVMQQSIPVGFTSWYSDTLASLLDTATELYHQGCSKSESDTRAWFVLQAFLWATWQQTVLIQLWYDAKHEMVIGYAYDRHNFLVAKSVPSVMPSRETVEKFRPNYMCKWAFELLRSDLSLVTQDFRRMFEVYNSHFGDRAARCNLPLSAADAVGGQGSTTSSSRQRVCDGKAPGNCQRFESDGVQIQSAHDFDCPRSACRFLIWDEHSYMNIKGARAVSMEETDEEFIRYCPVTSDTMAVSHVWSHGQGGRPETGFNICLHRKYTRIARALGCTSYWMDSPCVPTDNQLRDEAIGQINDNFTNSKVTLLVDRDLMNINIHPHSLEAMEAIVATLTVCDWNVRAWTLLEGMRGRTKLHILCKDNHIISLVDVLNEVLASSNLTLVSPCLALQHYTPTDYYTIEFPPVMIEQATCLLNHRHATKERDVTVIWSLVCGSKVFKSSEDFWKSKIGEPLATGFLVSGAPRLKDHRGFSWAPSRPNLLPPTAGTPNARQYPAFDGQESVWGRITPQGFKSEWLACLVRRSRALPTWVSLQRFDDDALRDSKFNTYYRVYNEGGNSKMDMKSLSGLRSVLSPVFKQYRWVALLLPALKDRGASGATTPPRPFPYQGEGRGGPAGGSGVE
ncbi:hypothetical protein N7451_012283 [Penicillium sp. IBT 35674x]|nr:hypothetical protein N7451_012283 [Penicillium sp. IBT 35674x]